MPIIIPMKNIFLTLSVLFLASCASQTVAPTATRAELEEEMRIQRELVNGTSKYSELGELEEAPGVTSAMQARFDKVTSRVKAAGKDLCVQIGEASCDFGFVLSEDKVLNAYADGSNVIITTAMMQFASEEEELVNVVAHEYAHNIMKHVQSKKGNFILGTLAGLAIDAAIGGGNMATQLGQSIGAQSYSVSFEQEADYVGLYIFARTGYDADKAIGFWRKMSQVNEAAIDTGVTHPTNPARFVAMKKTISEIEAKRAAGEHLIPRFKD